MAEKLDNAMSELSEVGALLRKLVDRSQTQVVVHRTEGPGALVWAAIVACFATWLGFVVMLIIVIPDLHDLRAWQSIDNKEIAQLKAEKRNQ